MFKAAMAGKFAIPAYNFNNMEQLQAIVMGCVESDSPFILQVSSGARKYANQVLLRFLAQGAVAMIRSTGSKLNFSCTWITATPSSCVSRASIPASRRS